MKLLEKDELDLALKASMDIALEKHAVPTVSILFMTFQVISPLLELFPKFYFLNLFMSFCLESFDLSKPSGTTTIFEEPLVPISKVIAFKGENLVPISKAIAHAVK